jgi:putative exosortase-associated protein (TIGR04073 family)
MKDRDRVILRPKAEESKSYRCFASLSMTSILIVLFLIPNAWAKDNYFKRSTEKLGRGMYNIVFSPLEITKAIESDFEEGQPYKMVFLAPMEGILKTGGRILVGTYEVATFIIPQKPILEPAYITPNIQEYTEAKHESKTDRPWSGLYPK